MRLAPRRLATVPTRRDDLEPRLRWTGFQASITPSALLEADRWELFGYIRVGGLRRRRAVFVVDGPGRTIDLAAGRTVLMQARVGADGRASVTVARRWVRIDDHRRTGGQLLEFRGEARLQDGEEAALQLTLTDGDAALRFPITVNGPAFLARVDIDALRAAADQPDAEWRMSVVSDAQAPAFSLAEHLAGSAWRAGGRDMTLERAADGAAVLTDRRRPALPTSVPLGRLFGATQLPRQATSQ